MWWVNSFLSTGPTTFVSWQQFSALTTWRSPRRGRFPSMEWESTHMDLSDTTILQTKASSRSLPDTRHMADPWDTPGLFALQAPGTSAIWYVPEDLPHCFDSCQVWAQLTKQVSGCGHLVSPVRSPWCSGFGFSTEINGIFGKLWPDYSTENIIRK